MQGVFLTVFYYGAENTIHGTTKLDIEVDPDGKVVAVWFRCMTLPFKVHRVSKKRGREMSRFNIDTGKMPLIALFFDKK